MRLSTFAGVLLSVAVSSWGDVSVNVPLDHWSYRFIERCEAKGLLTGTGDGIKPFSRLEVARALTRVDSVSRAGGGMALTRIEREELSLLMMEFSGEVSSPREEGAAVPGATARGFAAQARSASSVTKYATNRSRPVYGFDSVSTLSARKG